MADRFCFEVLDPGEGPLKALVPVEQEEEFKELMRVMGARGVEIESLRAEDVPADDEELVEEFVAEELAELSDPVCPLEPDVSWEESVCGLVEDVVVERVMANVLLAAALERGN